MCPVSSGTDGTQHETAMVWERNAAERQPNAMDARGPFQRSAGCWQRNSRAMQGRTGERQRDGSTWQRNAEKFQKNLCSNDQM